MKMKITKKTSDREVKLENVKRLMQFWAVSGHFWAINWYYEQLAFNTSLFSDLIPILDEHVLHMQRIKIIVVDSVWLRCRSPVRWAPVCKKVLIYLEKREGILSHLVHE